MEGEINLYGYVGSGPVNKSDPSGYVSGADFIPIVRNIKLQLETPKGARITDYANYAVTKQECCDDSMTAEVSCRVSISKARSLYIGVLWASGAPYLGVDFMKASLGVGLGMINPPAGIVVVGISAVDLVGNAIIGVAKTTDIVNAAEQAKNRYCNCAKYLKKMRGQ